MDGAIEKFMLEYPYWLIVVFNTRRITIEIQRMEFLERITQKTSI